MTVVLRYSSQFKKDVKRLIKKYRSLKSDLELLCAEITASPFSGTDLGHGVRKLRMPIASKGKGKRGGARVITYNLEGDKDDCLEVTLLTLYDKSEIENVSIEFIQSLVAEVLKEL